MTNLVRRRHSVTSLVVHLVFTPKYRRSVFTGAHIAVARDAFASVCARMDCQLIEMDGEPDHMHLLVQYPPALSVAKLVNALKAVSSRQLRQAFPDMRRLSRTSALWSRSYFASSAGGATIEVLQNYVRGQKTPD